MMVILGIIAVGIIIPVYAEDENSLLFKITQLEEKIVQKDAIIFEQTKVITMLAKNFKQTYEPFSLDKFPKTGGFNPDWLEGKRDKILKTCQEAKEMNYENPYCKYLQ